MSEELIDRLEKLAESLLIELDSLKEQSNEWRKKFEREESARIKADAENKRLAQELVQLNKLQRESEKWAQEKRKIRGKAKSILEKIESADFI